MNDQGLVEDHAFAAQRSDRPANPRLVLVVAMVSTLICAVICAGAILYRPPAGAIPFIVAVCVGGPIFNGWNVPSATAALRVERAGRALTRLRRALAALPETEHPLGF